MPRKPNPALLRRVWKDAGSDWDELKRQIEAALREPKKRRGPKQYVEPLLLDRGSLPCLRATRRSPDWEASEPDQSANTTGAGYGHSWSRPCRRNLNSK